MVGDDWVVGGDWVDALVWGSLCWSWVGFVFVWPHCCGAFGVGGDGEGGVDSGVGGDGGAVGDVEGWVAPDAVVWVYHAAVWVVADDAAAEEVGGEWDIEHFGPYSAGDAVSHEAGHDAGGGVAFWDPGWVWFAGALSGGHAAEWAASFEEGLEGVVSCLHDEVDDGPLGPFVEVE